MNTTVDLNYTSTTPNVTIPTETTGCGLFDDQTQCDVLLNLKRVSASLSIVGSFFTLCLIILFRKYREPSQRMIAHLSTGAFFYGIAYLVEDEIVSETTWRCVFQGAMLMMFVWVCFLWIICLLFNLYFQLLFGFDYRKYELLVTLICWILPVIIAALPFTDDVYAPAGVWCWFRNDFAWRYGSWYIWRIGFTLVFIVVMIHMSWILHKTKGNRHSSTHSKTCFEKDVQVLRIYPIIYFVLNLFSIMNRLHNLIEGADGSYNFVLTLLQCIVGPLFGVTIAVVYALDSRTRQSLNRKDISAAFQSWLHKKSTVKEYSGTVSTDDHGVSSTTEQASEQPDKTVVSVITETKQQTEQQVTSQDDTFVDISIGQ